MYQSIPTDMVESLLFSTFVPYFIPFFFGKKRERGPIQ